MYDIFYMDTASNDFAKIAEYLDGVGSGLADKIIGEIINRVDSLETMPFRYPKHFQRPQYRVTTVKSYSVFYKVKEDTHVVEIHRIIYGSRDIENAIKN
ncbi:MAG: type II toxin-antitoxin system RelE/ParE family toxin [Defluviitaleaceae bacterium]|nr:type II toxin-antitoxin system RelE/ParE family toxin [Defluviitaleaceae bacterium]MCL2262928.1 type II toxin-antitoxin system RelE/ParE family toxin [Defluviitaleaceae bacterium]